MEDLFDLAETEDAIDAAAPFVSAVALRTAMPNIATTRQTRRQLVSSVSQATRTLAHRQGSAPLEPVPRIVRGVSRTVAQRGLPARSAPLPCVVRRPSRPKSQHRAPFSPSAHHRVPPGRQSMLGDDLAPPVQRAFHSYRPRDRNDSDSRQLGNQPQWGQYGNESFSTQ